MVKSKVNKSLINLKKSIIDEIVDEIKKLNIDDEELIIRTINKDTIKKKRVPAKIPIEKQCTKKCKSGEKCIVPKCYKDTCWAHLNKNLRKEYQAIKALKN